MRRVQCPRCRKDFVRRFPLRGRWDRFLDAAHIRPFHCQLCGHRFRAIGDAETLPVEERAERREYERIAARLVATFSWEGGEGEGIVTDLSIAGCSLEVEAPISEGDLLRIQVQAEEDAPAISVEAAVVRYAGPWRVGIQFLRIQEAEKERLRGLLHRLFRERMAQRAARLGTPADGPERALEPGSERPADP